MPSPTFWLMAGKFALDLWGGYKKGEAAEAGGEASQWASYQNAKDLLAFAQKNAGYVLGAAERNARAYQIIGEANATAIEKATARNLMLYGMQADEEVRRHIYGEKMIAGNIRSMVGATGVQTNTGTPLVFLHSQVTEGVRQRRFMEAKHAAMLFKIAEEGKDKAFVTRLTAAENAAVIMSNAEAQSAVSILDAERQAAAMQRQGDLAQYQGQQAAQAHMYSAIGNAISTLGAGYQAGAFDWMSSSPSSNIAVSWEGANLGWQNTTLGSSFMNPYPAYGDSLNAIGFTPNTGFGSSQIINPYGNW